MNNLDIDEIIKMLKQYEYSKAYLETAKEEIRKLGKREINKINKETNLRIARSPQHFKTFTKDFTERRRALEAECLIVDKIKEDYKITLTVSNVAEMKTKVASKVAKVK